MLKLQFDQYITYERAIDIKYIIARRNKMNTIEMEASSLLWQFHEILQNHPDSRVRLCYWITNMQFFCLSLFVFSSKL